MNGLAEQERQLTELEQFQRDIDVLSTDDDFEAFINAPPSKLPFMDSFTNGEFVKRQMTVIEWWSQPLQRQSFPALSQLAIDVLSAFAMSAESERTFSRTRRTIDWSRSQLDAQTVR